MDWRPIESAPKANVRIITFGGGLVGTSRWVEKFALIYKHQGGGWYSDQLDRPHEPTHWMPLPEPPSE